MTFSRFRFSTWISRSHPMDGKQLRQLKPELDSFLERYLPLFGRPENYEHAGRFVQGLLGGQERRNTENVAEVVEGGVVRTMQKFVAQGCWEAADVLGELRRHMADAIGDDEGTINVDETGFPKKGTKSVGVKRQYSGTLGRVDNCQVGVFANYCSAQGHTLIDRRLFLPEEWAGDDERREEAGVPESVAFCTKPELGLEMVQTAVTQQIPFRWVGGDCVYGDSPTFVQGVRQLGKWYVLDVSSDARVWLSKPRRRKVGSSGPRGGRPRKNAKAISKPITVAEAVAGLPSSAFTRVTVSKGSQGPIIYSYAELTVWFSEEGYPADQTERLLVRRSLGQEPELKYHRSNAPEEVPMARLAAQRSLRWTIEEDIKAGKGTTGLDEYETRGWLGWHHHTALSMLALFFLMLQKLRLGEKRTANDGAGSSGTSPSSPRTASVGRRRNRRLEQLANGKKSSRKRMSRKTSSQRTAAAQ
jgi:SRSO17 transposase